MLAVGISLAAPGAPPGKPFEDSRTPAATETTLPGTMGAATASRDKPAGGFSANSSPTPAVSPLAAVCAPPLLSESLAATPESRVPSISVLGIAPEGLATGKGPPAEDAVAGTVSPEFQARLRTVSGVFPSINGAALAAPPACSRLSARFSADPPSRVSAPSLVSACPAGESKTGMPSASAAPSGEPTPLADADARPLPAPTEDPVRVVVNACGSARIETGIVVAAAHAIGQLAAAFAGPPCVAAFHPGSTPELVPEPGLAAVPEGPPDFVETELDEVRLRSEFSATHCAFPAARLVACGCDPVTAVRAACAVDLRDPEPLLAKLSAEPPFRASIAAPASDPSCPPPVARASSAPISPALPRLASCVCQLDRKFAAGAVLACLDPAPEPGFPLAPCAETSPAPACPAPQISIPAVTLMQGSMQKACQKGEEWVRGLSG